VHVLTSSSFETKTDEISCKKWGTSGEEKGTKLTGNIIRKLDGINTKIPVWRRVRMT
jgi:hypothetical protein